MMVWFTADEIVLTPRSISKQGDESGMELRCQPAFVFLRN
jgi:hypothetical protein